MEDAVRTKETSLHRRILQEVEGRIISGTWPPGHRIPSEHELTAQYNCSRMTVSKALGELATRGLIQRRRHHGSFVTRPQVQSAVLEIHDIRREVQERGLGYEYRMLSMDRRATDEMDKTRLDLPDGTEVLDIVCCHFADGLPFCHEERLINLTMIPDIDSVDFNREPPGSWLLERVPWSAAEHKVRAVSVDRDIARTLQLATATACLVIERRTWSTAGQITHVLLTYPGERHELVAQFSPSLAG